MYAVILSIVIFVYENWLLFDGTREFSVDHLKEALKITRASGRNVGESCFPLSWSTENLLLLSIILEPAENHCLHLSLVCLSLL